MIIQNVKYNNIIKILSKCKNVKDLAKLKKLIKKLIRNKNIKNLDKLKISKF